MTNVDSLLKRRVITLLTKVHLVKAMVFPVVMLEMEMATNSSILAWRIPGTEEPMVGSHLWGCTELDTTEVT